MLEAATSVNFWDLLDQLVASHPLVLDRPRGSPHPRFPEILYPLDYGYLEGTTSGDGSGIDVWLGVSGTRDLSAVILTVDPLKSDTEIKIMLGCSEDELQAVLVFHNNNRMRATLVRRPAESGDKMKIIPETHRDLLMDEKRAYAYLATLMPKGSPQVTPVWFNIAGDAILINSAEGRVKDKNMRARPTVALCIQDPANPYRYLQVRGRVVEITNEGADAHIDTLAGKYTGNFKYKNHQLGVKRVTYKILPEKVDAHG